jgi:putative peptidoglycan lipid II flippase
LGCTSAAVAVASLLLAAFAWFAPVPLAEWTAALPAWRSEILLAVLGAAGALIYGGVLLAGLKVLGVRLSRR